MIRFFSSPRFALGGFLFFVLLLFFYSFTQIDLSLTLSQSSIVKQVETAFQYVGYFNRPLSAELFFFVIIGLYIFYFLFLEQIEKKNISLRLLVRLIVGVTLLLSITYTAFSYDLFNYIFDAKIVTSYHENPYLHKALDYPGDPMLSFMRWTHRVYPYGPVWLALTVPLSFIGMQKFILTFFLFKFLMAVAFLGTVYFVYRIVKKLFPEWALYATAFFALNPLVLSESLISAHNDIVMLFFAVASLYFLVQKRIVLALLLLLASIALKFATVFLLPIFLFVLYKQYRKETVHWGYILFVAMLCMVGAVIVASLRTNFQPWYLLYLLPFAALLSHKKTVFYPTALFSITALFNYTPFLYTGNWDPPIPLILMNLNLFSVLIAVGIGIFFYQNDKKSLL